MPMGIEEKVRNLTDLLAYYKENYPGMSRGQLSQKDNSLYRRLRRDGLLQFIPLKKSN